MPGVDSPLRLRFAKASDSSASLSPPPATIEAPPCRPGLCYASQSCRALTVVPPRGALAWSFCGNGVLKFRVDGFPSAPRYRRR